MESRFADLRRRDTSVSMLRVKQSRRRSQCQKQNREQMVNTRRQLDKLPEADVSSQDVSMVTTSMSTVQEETQIKATPANTAAADRLKQLQKWKEQKELKKEKEKRERVKKSVQNWPLSTQRPIQFCSAASRPVCCIQFQRGADLPILRTAG